jgi:large subunit ribosomal protein L32
MGLPKRKHSTGRKGRRRSAIKIDLPILIVCPHCGQRKRPHLVCPHCGQYKETQVIKEKKPQKKKGTKS